MADECVNLEVGLSYQAPKRYRVDVRYWRPQDEDRQPPVTGTVQIDWEGLLALELNAVDYGRLLAQCLFGLWPPGFAVTPSHVQEQFDRAWEASYALRQPLRLRLWIDRMAPELHNLRWETLRGLGNDSRLTTNPQLFFSRFLGSIDRPSVQLRPRGDLRSLIFIANPQNLSNYGAADVEVDREKGRALEALAGLKPRVIASDLDEPGLASLDNLVSALHDGYDLVYLVCHGALEASHPNDLGRREALLYLEGPNGNAELISGTKLVDQVRDLPEPPRLLVLISCQSAGTGQSVDGGALSALGPRLAEAGIPAVLAMQGNVSMDTMVTFMREFFQQVCAHGFVDQALALARGRVSLRDDWWMPVLFMRLWGGRIWSVPRLVQTNFDPWPQLLGSIDDGQCTPILGPGLLNSLWGSPHEIAHRWAEEEAFPLAAHSREDLVQVAQYVAKKRDYPYARRKWLQYHREELSRRFWAGAPPPVVAKPLAALLSDASARPPSTLLESYRVLARLRSRVYITANPDSLLVSVLRGTGREPVVEYCRWKKSLAGQKPVFNPEQDVITPDRPLVFHLFGQLEQPDTLVLTEDDYFDYIMWVNKHEEAIPSEVRRAWSQDALLFLGFDIDDWNFRVLFRTIITEEGAAERQKLGPTSVAVQINPEEGRALQPDSAQKFLEKVFDRERISVFWGRSEDFIDQLRKRLP